MDNRKNDDKNLNNGGNGFFNKNPIMIFAIFAVVVVLVFKGLNGDVDGMPITGQSAVTAKNLSYSDIKEMIKNKQVAKVGISETSIKAVDNGGAVYTAKRVGDPTLVPLLEEQKIPYGAYSETNWFTEMIFSWVLPIFIFFGIWMFLASRMQRNMGSGILGMGSSKKLVNSEKPKVKFADVAGVQEAKEEVKEIVDFLKHPDRYINLGA